MTFSEYVIGIVIAVTATALIDVVMSEGETKKFVASVASLIVLTSIIAPLPSLISNIKDTVFGAENGGTSQVSSHADQRVTEYQSGIKERLAEARLEGVGISGAKVYVTCFATVSGEVTVESVVIDLSCAVISCKSENIVVTEQAVNCVSELLGTDKELIIVTE